MDTVLRRSVGIRWVAVGGALCALFSVGCRRESAAERSCRLLLRGVSEGDGGAVFDQLYEPTQWALHNIQRNHSRMRELITGGYPPGEQAGALSRLYGAEAENGRDLFGRVYAERYAAALQARLGGGAVTVTPVAGSTDVECRRAQAAGPPYRLGLGPGGRYGLRELAGEWEAAALRTFQDLATVEKNADIYRHAGPAGATSRPGTP